MAQMASPWSSCEDNQEEESPHMSRYRQHSTKSDNRMFVMKSHAEKIWNMDVNPHHVYRDVYSQHRNQIPACDDKQGLPIRLLMPGIKYFGDLPGNVGLDLVRNLDVANRWQQLLMVIDCERLRLSDLDISEVERGIQTAGGSCSKSLLDKLSTRGLTVRELAVYLDKANLLTALELLRRPEPIEFVVHPEDAEVEEKATLTLTCEAIGFPHPYYQWYYCNDKMVKLDGCCDKTLTLPDIRKSHSGWYAAQAHNFNKSKSGTSKWASVTVSECEVHRAKILKHPEPTELNIQFLQPLQLCCRAEGVPEPFYQWFRDNSPLDGQNKPILHIPECRGSDTGRYHCQVWNLPEYAVRSHSVSVKVMNDVDGSPRVGPRPIAQSKVALLIGTAKYMSAHHPLPAGRNDVLSLADHLRAMDFMVLSLVDLKKKEMIFHIKWFCKLLDEGVYGLFFYVGHGFNHWGQSFMVPWDATPCYRIEDCLSLEADVLAPILERSPTMCLAIIDICRLEASHIRQDEVPAKVKLKSFGNTCVIHATTPGFSSYEDKRTEKGILMTHLTGIIQQDMSVHELHTKLAQAIAKDPLLQASKQFPEIRSNLSDSLGLHDPVDYSGHTKAMTVRRLMWSCAHRKPDACTYVIKSHDAEINLDYKQVLSNELRMLVTITRFGSLSWVKVTVEEVPLTISGFHETDHVQVPGAPPRPTCIKFCGLQRLQGPLCPVLRVEMCVGDDKMTEVTEVTVDLGWPLVSKLNQWKGDEDSSS